MRGSLQEQLLQAGLVKKKSPNKPKKSTQKPSNKKHSKQNKTNKIENAQTPKVLADNELEKSLKVQIKQILKENKINDKTAETPYNYTVGNQIKRCFVSEAQLKQIGNGELLIVNWNERSYILPASFAEQLLSLHPQIKLFLNKDKDANKKDDDAYADFPIPDDLNW